MKKLVVIGMMVVSSVSFANEFQDEFKDVKTPTALTKLLGSVKIGDGAPVATVCGQSNEAYNGPSCVTGSVKVLKRIEAALRELGIQHDVTTPDAGANAGGN